LLRRSDQAFQRNQTDQGNCLIILDQQLQNEREKVSEMKYYGDVTFVIQQEDPNAPGNWKEYKVVKPYKGDWTRLESRWNPSDKINDDKRINNQLEIIADTFSSINFTNIRCIKWMGHQWAVTTVTPRPPKLVLEIGGLYNAGTESLSTP
jgi:hypothetical protein